MPMAGLSASTAITVKFLPFCRTLAGGESLTSQMEFTVAPPPPSLLVLRKDTLAVLAN
jgi:hypothetical protein